MNTNETLPNSIVTDFQVNGPLFAASLINLALILGLFVLAARSILLRGKGWEVPVWLLLSFFIPIIFPILALIHFRKSKFQAAS